VMIAHTRDAVVPPSQVLPGIPDDLDRVVLRCLAKRPADRYPDTPSLAEALAACDDARGWSPEHAAAWWRDHPDACQPEPDRPAVPVKDAGIRSSAVGVAGPPAEAPGTLQPFEASGLM